MAARISLDAVLDITWCSILCAMLFAQSPCFMREGFLIKWSDGLEKFNFTCETTWKPYVDRVPERNASQSDNAWSPFATSCKIAKKLLLSSTWPLIGIFCRPQRIITSIILVKACRFSADAVFCAQCCLFNPPDSREKAFSSSEVTDWKNLISLAKRHENLSHHRGCVAMVDNFIRAKQG
jgi:hypothetical protein